MKPFLAVAAIPLLMLSTPGPCGDDGWDESWEEEERWMEENNVEPAPTVAPYESCEAAAAAGVEKVRGGYEAWLVPGEPDPDGNGIVCEPHDAPAASPPPTDEPATETTGYEP